MTDKRLFFAIGGTLLLICCVGWSPSPTTATPKQRGEKIYARCKACHSLDRHRTGPKHCGIIGRRAGTAKGFQNYSDAMKKSSITWNAKTLDWFLQSPMTRVPGTSMGFAGVADKAERHDLIQYLIAEASPNAASCQ